MGDGTTSVIILGENSHPPHSPASFSPSPSTYAALFVGLSPCAIGIALLPSAQSEGGLASFVHRVDILLCVCVCVFAAGEMLHAAQPLLEKNLHPTVIVRGYLAALEDSVKVWQCGNGLQCLSRAICVLCNRTNPEPFPPTQFTF